MLFFANGLIIQTPKEYAEGKEDEMIGRIQKRTGETKENVNDFFDKLKF